MVGRLALVLGLLVGGALCGGPGHAGSVGPKVVYGRDNRVESSSMTGRWATDADATLALIWSSNVQDRGDGRSRLLGPSLADAYGLCRDQRFRDQPTAAHCSGALVDRDLVVTAGHCVGPADLKATRFVFGYRVLNGKAQTTVANRQIYKGKRIVARKLDGGGQDYAIVQLDREVKGHATARLKAVGNVAPQRPVHVIGYPSGLPEKVAAGARVRSSAKSYFSTNLDTFGGNSGSPIFDSVTHEVVGILVRGKLPDYRRRGSCNVVDTLSDGVGEEEATHASLIAAKLPRRQGAALLASAGPR